MNNSKIENEIIYQEMIKACLDNDITKLKTIMFDKNLNGHNLISFRSVLTESILKEVFVHCRLDMLNFFFDKKNLPNGIHFGELSQAIGYSTNIDMVNQSIQHYKHCFNDVFEKNLVKHYHLFLVNVLCSCIEQHNLNLFKYIFETYQKDIPSNHHYHFFSRITHHKSLEILTYLFQSSHYYFEPKDNHIVDLYQEYKKETPIWHYILFETPLMDREDILSEFFFLEPNAINHIQELRKKIKLNDTLNDTLLISTNKNQHKL